MVQVVNTQAVSIDPDHQATSEIEIANIDQVVKTVPSDLAASGNVIERFAMSDGRGRGIESMIGRGSMWRGDRIVRGAGVRRRSRGGVRGIGRLRGREDED